MTKKQFKLVGGRPKGAKNIPIDEIIRRNRDKLKRRVYLKALGGDIHAIKLCLQIIGELSNGGAK